MSSTSGLFLLDQSPMASWTGPWYLFVAEFESRPLRHKKMTSQMLNH